MRCITKTQSCLGLWATRILPGIDGLLKRCDPNDLNWVIVRENPKCEYAGVGSRVHQSYSIGAARGGDGECVIAHQRLGRQGDNSLGHTGGLRTAHHPCAAISITNAALLMSCVLGRFAVMNRKSTPLLYPRKFGRRRWCSQ